MQFEIRYFWKARCWFNGVAGSTVGGVERGGSVAWGNRPQWAATRIFKWEKLICGPTNLLKVLGHIKANL